MALLMKMTVMFSPLVAAWTVSAVPIAARSPSPWYVNITFSGLARLSPVATAWARPWGAWTMSQAK